MKSAELYKLFTICKILRELGYHKESALFMVKSKGKCPVILRLNLDNPWKLKHEDFNGYSCYDPRMGIPINSRGEYSPTLFEYYEHTGYMCTLPMKSQLLEFVSKLGYTVRDIDNLDMLLVDLVNIYRTHLNNNLAFEYCLKYIKNESSN